MTATLYPHRPPSPPIIYDRGYFDDTLLNVPQAQDNTVYAYCTSLDEDLGLVDPYTPPPLPDELAQQREYDPVRIAARNFAAVTMELLDDGSGTLRGHRELVETLAPRLDADAAAREAALQREHQARLFGDASPHRVERALRGYRPPSPSPPPVRKERAYASRDARLRAGEAPRTVRNPTPIPKAATPPPMLKPMGPGIGFSYEGVRPTATLLYCEPVFLEPEHDELPQCIDPIFVDPSAWGTDYRRQGAPKIVRKKRVAASRKIAQAGEKTKADVKQTAVSRRAKRVKPVQTHTSRRRNSLATRGNILVY